MEKLTELKATPSGIQALTQAATQACTPVSTPVLPPALLPVLPQARVRATPEAPQICWLLGEVADANREVEISHLSHQVGGFLASLHDSGEF